MQATDRLERQCLQAPRQERIVIVARIFDVDLQS